MIHSASAPAANGSLDFIFSGANNATVTGSADSEFLAATGTTATINGGAGTDMLIWNPGNTENGGTGFDILRIDQGAEFNTHVEDPGSIANPAVTSATVVLDPTHLSSIAGPSDNRRVGPFEYPWDRAQLRSAWRCVDGCPGNWVHGPGHN